MVETLATLLEQLRLATHDSATSSDLQAKLEPILQQLSTLEAAPTAAAEDAILLNKISSSLVEAPDMGAMLQVLYEQLGQGIRNLSMTEVVYGNDGLPTGLILRYIFDAEGKVTEPNLQLSRSMPPEVVLRLVDDMQRVGTQLEIVEETQGSPNPMHSQFLLQGIRSLVAIPILEDGRRIIQITFTWSTPHAFNARFLDILRAVQSQFTVIFQNRRLLERMNSTVEQSENQVQGLRLLSQINEVTNRETDEATMLNLAAKALHEYVGVDHVGIVTINATSGETRLVAEYPVTNMLRALLPNDENSLTAMLQKSRREIVIQDIAHSEQITPELREILLSVGSRAMFLQPLLDAEGALLGSIGFDISQPYGMPDGTRMEFARTVAAQLALTMQKMRLYENTQRQAAQIQKINRFTLSLQVSQDLPTVLMGLVALARSLDPFDYVGLHLYDSQLGALSVAARYDNGALEIPQGFVTSDPDNNTPLQVTFTESNASLIGDLESDGLWTHPKKGVIRTLAVYPLVNQRRNIGAMEIGNKKPYAYTAGEFAVFQQLANQTATTLANALAFKQSSEQTQRKLRTTELATLMQQQNDISAMMRVTVESLAQMLGARRVSIRLGTNAPQTERK